MAQPNLLFIGIQGTVLALDRSSGREVWRQQLSHMGFVNVVLDGGELSAATQGKVVRLEPATGAISWTNKLAGLGHGLVTIAAPTSQQAAVSREQQRRDEDAAAPIIVSE